MAVQIEPAKFPADAEAIYSLFSGYADSLGIDLTFQSFQEELDSLPGKYHEDQGGALLIARATGGQNTASGLPSVGSAQNLQDSQTHITVGCVALRRNTKEWCEMKRLYIVPEARGLRLGDKLVVGILDKAKQLGYRGIRLDTLASMTTAQRLYSRHGFSETEPYYDTPIKETKFLGLEFTKPWHDSA